MLPAIAVIALALIVLWFVAAPLLRSDAAESERVVSAESEAVDLQSRHAMLLGSLGDLEEDRATGKLSDEDYEQQHEALAALAVDVMKKMDALPDPKTTPPVGPRSLDSSDDSGA
jgi:hypothetical protein